MKKDIALESLKERLVFLEKVVSEADKQLKKSPPGRLRIQRQGNSVAYYCVQNSKEFKDNNGQRIDNSNRNLIAALAQKSYINNVRRYAVAEAKAIRWLLDGYPKKTVESALDNIKGDRLKLLQPVALSDEEYVKKWIAKPYTPKGFSETDPNFKTLKGDRVRSKSEQIIADRLFVNNVPYKYECPIMVGNKLFHPDFTVLKIKERKVIYWEHCGIMDKQSYSDYAVNRFNKYSKQGIIIGDNLIATFETDNNPLDTETVDNLINAHFK
ncbi:MAG: hypothetical protein K6F79_09610 [Saccharofermentans sp.]|nr:hypothetical protein [Saccharofermentans sp.]